MKYVLWLLLIVSSVSAGFIRLDHSLTVVAPASPRYNCIAFSIGNTSEWIQGDLGCVYARYTLTDEAHAEIAVYEGYHAARRIEGEWYSKLGDGPVVAHDLRDKTIQGWYGQPKQFYH